MNPMELILTIWPLILLQAVFQLYALYDLIFVKKGRTKNLGAWIWVIIIVLGEILGAALYFIFGRSEE
jgi:hypothetical protein